MMDEICGESRAVLFVPTSIKMDKFSNLFDIFRAKRISSLQ